ncbi:Gfo/Idh/MocA family protein [Chloroflexota bacterium]
MAKPITALLFGAGSRGADAYGPYALTHPDQIKFVAVAEPDPWRRKRFAEAHGITAEACFESWRDALEQGKIADVVINCTQDQMHKESGVAAIEAGYDMLLEKPIANTLSDSIMIVQAAEEHERYLQICHVLRHTEFFKKLHEILRAGRLGQLITISHRENVSAWHMAHSFVRGNWRREDRSSPMILAKCCHDLDLLVWLTGKLPTRLSSHGSLIHFRSENAPDSAPERCTDGCPVEATCPFYAPAIYIQLLPFKHAVSRTSNPLYRFMGNLSLKRPNLTEVIAKMIPQARQLTEYSGWPRSVICDDPGDDDALLKALTEGPYGLCVYHCDNDVVDHQVVAIEFKGGITASLTMHGHSHEEGRTLRIDGSKASLLAKFGFSRTNIEIHDHRSMEVERIDFLSNVENVGHGGGDSGIMENFIRIISSGNPATSSARESLESHLMAFAAEDSRHNQVVVDMADFREEAERQARI